MNNQLFLLYNWMVNSQGVNPYVAQFIFGLIVSFLLLSIPVVVATIVPLIIKKPKKEFSIYLYSFITGMFIILGSFGYLREAIEITGTGKGLRGTNFQPWQIYTYNIFIIVGGALIGILSAFSIKAIVYKIMKSKYQTNSIFVHTHEAGHHEHEQEHKHEHHDHIWNANDLADVQGQNSLKTKNKLTALILLLAHRIPEGLLIGLSLRSLTVNNNVSAISVAFFVSFVLHTIPEEIVFFYRQREMGISAFRASLNSIFALSLIIPFIFIGLYGGSIIEAYPALKALIMAIVGSVMIFTSFVEFLPEFYHHNLGKKRWFITLFMFFLGIVFTLFILSFHQHGAQLS
ncbi:ZIP family metal transporter [Mycoplasma simbae]|uniref:ZIP family metal transporter n=1 Tax=Mycoplasma simbae TaxID=36744 RepID=UPI00068B3AB6|nr:ZIP family metal transporter [Mycoplasma simbae]